MVSADGTPLTTAPLPHKDRVIALDALRGLAVIGIVPMNVIAFSMPPAAYFNPRSYGGDGPLEVALWAVSFLLIEDKFRTLFAMMFGAGVAILLGKASAHPLRGHYARMLVLLAIAMLHAIMLANNDVLRSYAVAGMLLPVAIGWRVRTLLWAAAAIMAGQFLVSGWFAWDWLAYWYERASGALVDPAAQMQAESDYGYNPQAIAAATERASDALGERIVRRVGEFPQQATFVVASLPSTIAAMLAGVALWRSGLLAGQWPASRAYALAARCAVIALPILAALAVWTIATGFDPIVTTANAIVWSALFDMLAGIGWAALAMALFGGALRDSKVTARLAATGRLALTNYLATSLVFALLFLGWGYGLFGEVSRGQALLLALIPVVLMLGWSPLWLAHFRQGPAEWLWRSLASGSRLALRR
ncbi:DUF418 domain-containing protein [Erythrobacter alti]|uniref:DUF418 domain-containing protein n=1 Tax=Erythrobacter alti TaxID=1896145 RepID=UPI003BF543BD